jgi:hypothetical protein
MAEVDVQPNSSDSADVVAPNIPGSPAGSPTAPTSQVGSGPTTPQPSAPPKETFGEGVARGVKGRQYMVDGTGAVVDASTAAPSKKGTFGSILSGIVMGALQGARVARPGKIPSQEIGGGPGAGVNAAIEGAQQQDARNRGKAEQDFANQAAVKKMSREDAESAAQINHMAADTARIAQESKFADDEHPLNMALKKAGLDESAQNIQKNSQEILTNSLNIAKTLGEVLPPEAVSAFVTNWNDGQKHIPDIVQGRSLPLHNGETGSDNALAMHDTRSLQQTPLLKSAAYKTYTADKDGNAVAQERTMHAGASSFEYAMAALAGNSQLQQINQQQRIKAAADLNKADIQEKRASAFKASAEGKKAEAETVGMKDAIQGQAQDLVESDMDPSQIQKRGSQYTPILAAAREYSLKKYGVPFDLAKAQADYKFSSDPKTQNRLKYMNSLVGDERTGSSGNLDLLVQYSDKLKRTDFPALNDVAAWARLESGDTNIIKFHNAAVDAADQFANIMNGGGSGSATSDAKIKQGLEMFNKGFSKDQIRASAGSVKDMLSNRKREFIGDNRYLRKQYLPNSISDSSSGGSNPTKTPSASSLAKGSLIQIGKQQYSYTGTGDTKDIKNYTVVGGQ